MPAPESQPLPNTAAREPDSAEPWSAEAETKDALLNLLYDELRRIAGAHLRKERPDHTLSPTGLAHEAWMRLQEQQRAQFQSRGHYLATASMMMRRILVNHALAKRMQKRDAQLLSLDDTAVGGQALELQVAWGAPSPELVIDVHEALAELAQAHPRSAQVVEMKFFGGVEHGDIALALGISVATVKREWQFARAWLHRALQGDSGGAAGVGAEFS